MSDLRDELGTLAGRVGGLTAALVLETTGIDVATWGRAEFEVATAELAGAWKFVSSTELVSTLGAAAPDSLEVRVGAQSWLLFALGGDYLLGLLLGPEAVAGRARFYAIEWAAAHREDFG